MSNIDESMTKRKSMTGEDILMQLAVRMLIAIPMGDRCHRTLSSSPFGVCYGPRTKPHAVDDRPSLGEKELSLAA
jgi:hypothetical protein